MNSVRVIALVLIIGGALGLAYGGFSYTKENHEAKIGPLDVSVQEKQVVNVPLWVGVGAIVVGAVLLLSPRR
jgi:TRAP-type C4-dicarboxylate transport system permease small subunit